MSNIFEEYSKGLNKTRKGFFGKFIDVITNNKNIDENLIEKIEEHLIRADISFEVVESIIDDVREKSGSGEYNLEVLFKDSLYNILKGKNRNLQKANNPPAVYFFVGVNGVGKTTTISKIGKKLKDEGHKVMLVAGDTYRAAGGEQMKEWADKLGLKVVQQKRGADAAALVYDSIESAISKKYDYVLIDTAGRLHTRKNLMNELDKINHTIKKKLGRFADENILIIDATTGQNALKQVEKFKEKVNISSIIVTKMDGSAKGGIIFSIEKKFDIPVTHIGLGEKENHLKKFDPEIFIQSLFKVER